MLYLAWEFGNPLTFAETQRHWSLGAPTEYSMLEKAWSLATIEPIIGVYDPTSARYWGRYETGSAPIFNIMFINPLFFSLSVVFLVIGCYRRWLSGPEIALGAGLLGIPYLTRAYEMSMGSHARFAAIATANYLVIGRLCDRATMSVRFAVCLVLGTLLCLYTSVYASGRLFF